MDIIEYLEYIFSATLIAIVVGGLMLTIMCPLQKPTTYENDNNCVNKLLKP